MSNVDSNYPTDASNEEVLSAPSTEQEENSTGTGTCGCSATIVLKRDGAESEVAFKLNGPVTIGRFDPAVGPIDIDMKDLPEGAYISRKHAKISCTDGQWELSDLGSSNGTWILAEDGLFERIETAPIHDGQDFALGNARFVFFSGCSEDCNCSSNEAESASQEQEPAPNSEPENAPI